MNAYLASLFLKLYVHFDKKSGGTPLFIHHQRRCAKCHHPIRRNEQWRMIEGGRTAHRNCDFPSGRSPLPEPLSTYIDEGPNAA